MVLNLAESEKKVYKGQNLNIQEQDIFKLFYRIRHLSNLRFSSSEMYRATYVTDILYCQSSYEMHLSSMLSPCTISITQ
jgi:hypothetical protein